MLCRFFFLPRIFFFALFFFALFFSSCLLFAPLLLPFLLDYISDPISPLSSEKKDSLRSRLSVYETPQQRRALLDRERDTTNVLNALEEERRRRNLCRREEEEAKKFFSRDDDASSFEEDDVSRDCVSRRPPLIIFRNDCRRRVQDEK